jgi:hypothetical protein
MFKWLQPYRKRGNNVNCSTAYFLLSLFYNGMFWREGNKGKKEEGDEGLRYKINHFPLNSKGFYISTHTTLKPGALCCCRGSTDASLFFLLLL